MDEKEALKKLIEVVASQACKIVDLLEERGKLHGTKMLRERGLGYILPALKVKSVRLEYINPEHPDLDTLVDLVGYGLLALAILTPGIWEVDNEIVDPANNNSLQNFD